APGVVGLAGRRAEVSSVRGPVLVEEVHVELADVLRKHGGERDGEVLRLAVAREDDAEIGRVVANEAITRDLRPLLLDRDAARLESVEELPSVVGASTLAIDEDEDGLVAIAGPEPAQEGPDGEEGDLRLVLRPRELAVELADLDRHGRQSHELGLSFLEDGREVLRPLPDDGGERVARERHVAP